MIIGICSICGGPVEIPDVWGGIIPPTRRCIGCGAIAAEHGRVIQMTRQPVDYRAVKSVSGTAKEKS